MVIFLKANFLHHKWQSDTIKIGEVPKDFVAKISNNLFNDTDMLKLINIFGRRL